MFLDWSQNTAAKTTITPYSLRGRGTPYVAAPRTWDEIEAGAEDPDEIEHLLLDQVLARIDADGDIFGDQLGTDPGLSALDNTKPAVPGMRRVSSLANVTNLYFPRSRQRQTSQPGETGHISA